LILANLIIWRWKLSDTFWHKWRGQKRKKELATKHEAGQLEFYHYFEEVGPF
jgi:hypothetical protein